jgi:hypothetical protein
LAATAAAIGGAGIILGSPAAGLLAAPGLAHAAPAVPAPQQLGNVGSIFGSSGLGGISDLLTPVFAIAGAIPIVNIFIGNGANGTAAHPDGFPGGIFGGNGGNGFSPTATGADGGNGGAAGMFGGHGGNGGNGAPGLDFPRAGKFVATSTAPNGADAVPSGHAR